MTHLVEAPYVGSNGSFGALLVGYAAECANSKTQKIDEHGLTVHAACQASRAVPMKSESPVHANALRQNRPVEFLHGFAVKDF